VTKMTKRSVPAAVLGLALLGAGVPTGAEQRLLVKGHDPVAAPELQWVVADSLPPGARMIMLHGAPTSRGLTSSGQVPGRLQAAAPSSPGRPLGDGAHWQLLVRSRR
jgi:hypothetical protein